MIFPDFFSVGRNMETFKKLPTKKLSKIDIKISASLIYQTFCFYHYWCNSVKFISSNTGYLAWRSTKTGSWFISSLCDVLQEQASGTDLMVMLTEVSQRVSSMATRKASLEEAEEAVKQCLEKSTTLTKKLYFNPSKTFEEYQDD